MAKNKINPTRNYLVKRYDEDEMYDFGGWMKENAVPLLSTVAGGIMTATGVGAGAGIPLLASGVGGMLGNALADDPKVTDYSEEIVMPRTVGRQNLTPNVMSFKKGGSIDTAKAKKILSEENPTLNGHPITDRQKRWLGWIAGGKKQFGGSIEDLNSLDLIQEKDEYKKGGSIHIKPENKGKFNALKKRTGKTTEELTHSKNPLTRKRAIFAQNARKFKHELGGEIEGEQPMNGQRLPMIQFQGNTHDEGGIDFLPDAEVEGGETMMNNVVNSDSIKITKGIAKKYNLPNLSIGKTVAEYSKKIESDFDKREGDPFAMNTRNLQLNNISRMSEDLAKEKESNQFQGGGPLKKGWGFPKQGERWDPFQNENLKAPGFYSGIGLFNNEGDDTVFDIPISKGYREPVEQKVTLPDIIKPKGKAITSVIPLRVFDSGVSKASNDFNLEGYFPDFPTGDNLQSYSGTKPGDLTKRQLRQQVRSAGAGTLQNIDWEQTGMDILGAAPMAISAFQVAKAAKEGPDQVKLSRIHADTFNPALIDPSWQLKETGDTFSTANQTMAQISRKDYLRRRIQSATEESKVKSGILGQTSAMNTGILNQAKQINAQNKLRAEMFNVEAGMQEENINAANEGAWRTNKDYQLNNLATMAGEYGRDLQLRKANENYNSRFFDTVKNLYPGMTYDPSEGWKITGSPIATDTSSVYDYSPSQVSPTGNPVTYEDLELQDNVGNLSGNWNRRFNRANNFGLNVSPLKYNSYGR